MPNCDADYNYTWNNLSAASEQRKEASKMFTTRNILFHRTFCVRNFCLLINCLYVVPLCLPQDNSQPICRYRNINNLCYDHTWQVESRILFSFPSQTRIFPGVALCQLGERLLSGQRLGTGEGEEDASRAPQMALGEARDCSTGYCCNFIKETSRNVYHQRHFSTLSKCSDTSVFRF